MCMWRTTDGGDESVNYSSSLRILCLMPDSLYISNNWMGIWSTLKQIQFSVKTSIFAVPFDTSHAIFVSHFSEVFFLFVAAVSSIFFVFAFYCHYETEFDSTQECIRLSRFLVKLWYFPSLDCPASLWNIVLLCINSFFGQSNYDYHEFRNNCHHFNT